MGREEKSGKNGTKGMDIRDSPGRIPEILRDWKTWDGRKGQRWYSQIEGAEEGR